jgi:hypothetical protein
MIRYALAPLLLLASACASAPGTAAGPTATPAQLHARVASFAQPTQDGRLAALKAQLDAAKLSYVVEDFPGKRPSGPGHNVVVRTGPATGKAILLTAHYDVETLPDGRLVDGVVDNAASVVSMIETMQRISGHTKHPVILLVTDQEELGLVGAKAWVEKHGTADLAAVINADINAYGDTLMHGLNNGAQSAGITTAVRELCTAKAMSCLDFPQYPPSDDQVFSAAGVPTVSLGYLPKAEAEALKVFLTDPAAAMKAKTPMPAILGLIHTPNDKIEKVEPATLAASAETFTSLIMKLDAELP